MKVISIKLDGKTWRMVLAVGAVAARHDYTMPQQGQETLADAAVRIEDILRQLRCGELKAA